MGGMGDKMNMGGGGEGGGGIGEKMGGMKEGMMDSARGMYEKVCIPNSSYMISVVLTILNRQWVRGPSEG
jgi:hypothetical protein